MQAYPVQKLHNLLLACGVAVGTAVTPAVASAQEGGGDLDRLEGLISDWMASPHGNHGALAFTYWNEDGEVPVNCAACHSGPGFVDYLGADGSTAMSVDHPAPINSRVDCAACHTSEAHALDAVPFPSGVTVAGLGTSAVCSVCHQGRQSSVSVDAATADFDPDAVGDNLSFLNVHYGIAAAVMHGSDVQGGYQYPGRSYAGRFAHVPGADTCTACHDPHTTEVATDGCLACHRGVDDLRDIRMRHDDFDGDGATHGGIHAEIVGLQNRLYDGIQLYAAEVAGTPIGYADSFPYFFADPDGDGTITPDEATMANRYASWTPRLLRAAYNYQVAKKDPGGFVHNPAYVLQLLHDSLTDLAEAVAADTAGVRRP